MTAVDETERLNDLIARCEKASGPDRGLDVDIWTEVAPQDAEHSLKMAVRDVRDCNPVLVLRDRAPKFTASLDAAMTLVPKHYTPNLCLPPHTTCEVRLWRHVSGECSTVRDSQDQDVEAEGRTGPLALVIAALKARLTR